MADSVNINQRFDIDNFRAAIKKNSFHRPSHFTLVIDTLPNGLRGSNFAQQSESIKNELIFRVEATTVPGVDMATTPIRRYGIGALEQKPYVPVFNFQDIMIQSDGAGETHSFFSSWLKLVTNFDTRNSIDNNSGIMSGQTGYEVAYKDDYKTNLTMIAFNMKGQEIIKIKMREAYPISVSPLNMAWSDTASIAKYNVRFTYFDWYQEDANISALSASSPTSSGSNELPPVTSPGSAFSGGGFSGGGGGGGGGGGF